MRGLARVMDFMRAVSILFVGINVYWFCYSTLKEWGVTFEVIDKILWNFQRTTGLFSSVLWTKLFAVVFLALSCIGTKGVKEEKITWTKIHCSLAAGVGLVFLKGGGVSFTNLRRPAGRGGWVGVGGVGG